MRRSRRERPAGATADSAAFLVVPGGVDLRLLATVTYAGATWLIDPEQAREARLAIPVGARYGSRFESEPTEAQLRLAEDLIVTGPLEDEQTETVIARLGPSSPLGADAHAYRIPTGALAWARGVARSHGGAVLTPTGGIETRWVAEHLTVLRLFSPSRLNPVAAVDVLHGALPAAGLVWQDEDEPHRASYAIRQDLSYDGGVLVRYDFAKDVRPAMLAHVDWREYGPHVHHIAWVPGGHDDAVSPDGIGTDGNGTDGNGTGAALRATTWIARTARVLRNAIGGTVLDRDGFPLDEAALTRTNG